MIIPPRVSSALVSGFDSGTSSKRPAFTVENIPNSNEVVIRFNSNTVLETLEGVFSDDILKYTSAKDVIVLDLSNVKRFDSSGLGFLVSLNKKAKEQGKELFLSGVEKVLGFQEQLELTKLTKLFKFRQPVVET